LRRRPGRFAMALRSFLTYALVRPISRTRSPSVNYGGVPDFGIPPKIVQHRVSHRLHNPRILALQSSTSTTPPIRPYPPCRAVSLTSSSLARTSTDLMPNASTAGSSSSGRRRRWPSSPSSLPALSLALSSNNQAIQAPLLSLPTRLSEPDVGLGRSTPAIIMDATSFFLAIGLARKGIGFGAF